MQSTKHAQVEWPTTGVTTWLRLFGEPLLCWHGQRYALVRRQPQALFYYLALHEQPVTRAALCRLFWPDEATVAALRRLTHVLDDLKRSLPTPELLVKEAETITLNSTGFAIDTHAFGALTGPSAPIQALIQAITFYQAPLLANFVLPNHPAFEIWLLGERAAWEARYLAVLVRLVEQLMVAGQWQSAIRYALRYLYSDVTEEAMHRMLIELYGRVGDRDAVQRQYRWCASTLARELGTQPTPATQSAYAVALHRPRCL